MGVVCDDVTVANFRNEQLSDFLLARNRLQDALYRKPAGSCSHRKKPAPDPSVFSKGIRIEFLQVGADEFLVDLAFKDQIRKCTCTICFDLFEGFLGGVLQPDPKVLCEKLLDLFR